MTENQPHLQNRKADELQTWRTNGVWWPASPTCAVTTNLKALGGCSSHHLQGAGTYCGGSTTGHTACYICTSIQNSVSICLLPTNAAPLGSTPHMLIFPCVCNVSRTGWQSTTVVIGCGEQSGARINISDSSCSERIITVRGTRQQLICAFSMICRRIEQVTVVCLHDDLTHSLTARYRTTTVSYTPSSSVFQFATHNRPHLLNATTFGHGDIGLH